MNWTEQVFRYCERGLDPAFWGEPLNAVSNLGFVVAGLLALIGIARLPPERRGVMPAVLAVLVLVIGVGSFLFHTFATRWSALADTIPIGLFMLAYLGYALRRYLGLGWLVVGCGLIVFVLALRFAGSIECRPGLFTAGGTAPCLNGTLGYAPALIALVIIGGWLACRRHAAGAPLLAGAAVLTVSMLMRTVDIEICERAALLGHPIGTHALWHLLNALMLFLLLGAATRDRLRA